MISINVSIYNVPRDGLSDIDPSSLITPQFVNDLFLMRSVSWAGLAVLVFDFLLTFQDEVAYIWPARWSGVKYIFLGNRYGNIILVAIVNAQQAGTYRSDSEKFCINYTIVSTVFQFIAFISIHVLVVLRTWAVCRVKPRIAVSLLAMLILYVLAGIGLMIYAGAVTGEDTFATSFIVGTCVTYVAPLVWLIWVPSLALETGVFLLTLWSLRYHAKAYPSDRTFRLSPVFFVLYRDAFIYFAFILFVNLSNLLTWVYYPSRPLNMLVSTFTLALSSVAGQRLVLDLREVHTAATVSPSTTRLEREVDRQIDALRSSPSQSKSPPDSEAPEENVELENLRRCDPIVRSNFDPGGDHAQDEILSVRGDAEPNSISL